MSEEPTPNPAWPDSKVLAAVTDEAASIVWFVLSLWHTNVSSYMKLSDYARESAVTAEYIGDLARRLLPHPDTCSDTWYRNVFRNAEVTEGVPTETALEALRNLNCSLRQRFFASLRLARSNYSPTPFTDTLAFLQKVQRRPFPCRQPLDDLFETFPTPSIGGLTSSALLSLIDDMGTDARMRVRDEMRALTPQARGLLGRSLEVFHAVYSSHPGYRFLFAVALDAMLSSISDTQRSFTRWMLASQPTHARIDLVARIL